MFVAHNQCDQIWQNFANLVLKVFGYIFQCVFLLSTILSLFWPEHATVPIFVSGKWANIEQSM